MTPLLHAQKRRGQEINDFSRPFQGTLKEMGHDAVLAQYFILDDHVEILLTTPNAVLARQAPIKREDLNEKIAAYRKTLSSPRQDRVKARRGTPMGNRTNPGTFCAGAGILGRRR
jgi:hypothetical protein